MANDRRLARQLSTRSEFQLISASYADAIGRLSKRDLKSKIARARRLRDKQRDLYRRQRLASRARSGTKHGSSARTAQKAGLFNEALSRFTQRLRALEAAERRKTQQPAGKGPKPKSRRAGAPKRRAQADLLQKARSPRMKSIQAHVGGRGRRRQARRDSR
jgi:hypothetical protein